MSDNMTLVKYYTSSYILKVWFLLAAVNFGLASAGYLGFALSRIEAEPNQGARVDEVRSENKRLRPVMFLQRVPLCSWEGKFRAVLCDCL